MYGDFECPYCGQAEVVIRELLDVTAIDGIHPTGGPNGPNGARIDSLPVSAKSST